MAGNTDSEYLWWVTLQAGREGRAGTHREGGRGRMRRGRGRGRDAETEEADVAGGARLPACTEGTCGVQRGGQGRREGADRVGMSWGAAFFPGLLLTFVPVVCVLCACRVVSDAPQHCQ